MSEQYKQSPYDYEMDDTAEMEQLRQRRIARRKKLQRQRRNRRLLLCAVLVLIAILVWILLFFVRVSQPLKGLWAYGEAATIQFSGKGRGEILFSDMEYGFSYTVEGNSLQMAFDNPYLVDARYTFTVENGTLVLSGGDGTMGGTYDLTKIKKQ